MDVYYLLLQESGIEVDKVELSKVEGVREVTPFFKTITRIPSTIKQVDTYVYYETPMYALDYKQEVEHERNKTRPHFYCRRERFKITVLQLLGIGGSVPWKVRELVRKGLGPGVSKRKIWNNIRIILKRNGLRAFYNMIPQIIYQLTNIGPIGVTCDNLQAIKTKFSDYHEQFNNHLKNKWNREYFPNLRFVALKLCQQHGITYPYTIPLARTSRKKKYLEHLYTDFA